MTAEERERLIAGMVTAGCSAYASTPPLQRSVARSTAGLAAVTMMERVARAMLEEVLRTCSVEKKA